MSNLIFYNHQKGNYVFIYTNGVFVNASRDTREDGMTTSSAETDTELERDRARDLTNILTT